MTKAEKRKFIKNFMGSVQKELLEKVDRAVPAEWDGHELRVWIAETFTWEAAGTRGQNGLMSGTRYRDYKNEVIVRNL